MRYSILLLLLFYAGPPAQSQVPEGGCFKSRIFPGSGAAMKTTVLSPQENLYDVKWVRLDLQMDNMSTSVSGNASTKAVVTGTGMNAYCFELNPALTIDSVKLNGSLVSVITQSSGLRSVTLGSAPAVGSSFTATVWYHGSIPSTNVLHSWYDYGLLNYESNGHKVTMTNGSFLHADDWWPAKQSLTDKIDSVDLWFTVPDSCQAASNGLLKPITAMPGGKRRYEWKSNYPIDFYLISVTIATYTDERFYMHYTDGSGDSTLIQNFYYETTGNYPDFKARFDSVGLIIDYFSGLMGRYPFWKEKYGHCMVPNNAGFAMEHQTMSSMNWYSMTLVAHELGHQWWGDMVTFRSFRDIWLNEGLANFVEYLYLEHFGGAAAAKAQRGTNFSTASIGLGTVICDDTTDATRVYGSRLSYKKGGAVLHMLRKLIDNDSLFFMGLRAYGQQHAFATAVTQDLQSVFEAASGRDLDTFFNQWVYREGVPSFTGAWIIAGNTLLIRVDQSTTAPASVSVFNTPLEILIKSSAGDTTIRVYNNLNTQYYAVPSWNKPVSYCIIDPDYHVLRTSGVAALIQDERLSLSMTGGQTVLSVSPNPTLASWTVSGLSAESGLYLTDMSGRTVWQKDGAAGAEAIPAASLPAGVYLLQVRAPGMSSRQLRLQKL